MGGHQAGLTLSSVTVCVEPAAQWRPGVDEDPWEIGPATPALVARAELSLREQLTEARAATAGNRAGEWSRYQGRSRETIVAVKLSDRCDHDTKGWKPGSCGRCWCELCHGFVDRVSRVALKGVGPVIHCNRKPNFEKGCAMYFRGCGFNVGRLTALMRRVL